MQFPSGTVYAKTSAMKHPFEPIKLPKKTPSQQHGYRVYSAPGQFKLVTAENAAEALKASGLAEAWRIERYAPTLQAVLDSQIFSEVAATPPAAKTADAPAPAEPKPAADAPLSSDDVNKLLGG